MCYFGTKVRPCKVGPSETPGIAPRVARSLSLSFDDSFEDWSSMPTKGEEPDVLDKETALGEPCF